MIQLRSLNTQLSELKSAFDEAILKGNSFAEVKKIYAQIKEVERLIAIRQLELLQAGRVEE
jgi:hypothetical protein